MISLGAGVGRVGLAVVKTSLDVALFIPETVIKGVVGVGKGAGEAVTRADKALQDVGRKCGL